MRSYLILRVFTRDDLGGNHLGVVTDLDGLDGAAMQQITAGLGYSETVFIDGAAPPRVRIFTPAAEMPFAGHPLVGAAWVVGVHEERATDRVVCGVGEIPFRTEGSTVWVDTPMVTDVAPADDGGEIAAAAGLPTTGRTWWARMPLPYLVVEAPSAAEVASAAPDFGALLAGPAGEAALLYARDGGRVKARFFAAGLGVPEDPATGSAAASLAAVLAHEGEASGHLSISQGDEIGHPSTIEVSWSPQACSLGGTVRLDGERWL
ncbi:MAG: PhzF family phenazine biosynthesis protein [Actinobacteria bacterium]|nr:PhzF family phenazine biosynthesis protein [Actinomycetota bacterium]